MNLLLLLVLIGATADIFLTAHTLRIYRKVYPHDKRWYMHELNPIPRFLFKRLGILKTVLIFYPIVMFIFIASGITEYGFFYGVYLILNIIHLHNIELYSKKLKIKESRLAS